MSDAAHAILSLILIPDIGFENKPEHFFIFTIVM